MSRPAYDSHSEEGGDAGDDEEDGYDDDEFEREEEDNQNDDDESVGKLNRRAAGIDITKPVHNINNL